MPRKVNAIPPDQPIRQLFPDRFYLFSYRRFYSAVEEVASNLGDLGKNCGWGDLRSKSLGPDFASRRFDWPKRGSTDKIKVEAQGC